MQELIRLKNSLIYTREKQLQTIEDLIKSFEAIVQNAQDLKVQIETIDSIIDSLSKQDNIPPAKKLKSFHPAAGTLANQVFIEQPKAVPVAESVTTQINSNNTAPHLGLSMGNQPVLSFIPAKPNTNTNSSNIPPNHMQVKSKPLIAKSPDSVNSTSKQASAQSLTHQIPPQGTSNACLKLKNPAPMPSQVIVNPPSKAAASSQNQVHSSTQQITNISLKTASRSTQQVPAKPISNNTTLDKVIPTPPRNSPQITNPMLQQTTTAKRPKRSLTSKKICLSFNTQEGCDALEICMLDHLCGFCSGSHTIQDCPDVNNNWGICLPFNTKMVYCIN